LGIPPKMIDLFNTKESELIRKWHHIIEGTKAMRKAQLWTSDAEIGWFAELATQSGRHAIEVGSHAGRSAKAQLMSNSGLHLVCIDNWDDEGAFDAFFENLIDFNDRFTALRGQSHECLDDLSKIYPDSYDYAIIDAGHLYDDVKGDIYFAKKLVKPGGILCGHDYRPNLPQDGVTKAVRECLPGYKNVIDSIWAIKL
jgi:predicted O-methyltransferase YrrM